MISGISRWYTVGAHLVTAVKAGVTPALERWSQTPGDIAWDECHCKGVLAVTTPRVFLSELFPTEADAPVGARCQAPFEVGEFTVSIVRCSPQPQGQKLAPEPSELDAAAARLLQDIAQTLDAVSSVLCALKDNDDVSDYFINPAESAGPEGACVGFTLRVLVALDRY